MAEISKQHPEDLIKLPDSEDYEPKTPAEAGRLAAERLLEQAYNEQESDIRVQNVGVSKKTLTEIFRQAVEDGWVENTDNEEFMTAFLERFELGYPAWKN